MNRRNELSPSDRAERLWAPTLSLRETAEVLGVGLTSLRDALRSGQLDLPVLPIGQRRVIPTAAVRRLLGMEELVGIAPASESPHGVHATTT